MAWPTDDIVTTNIDAGADSPATARANLYTALLRIKDIIAGRNTANGVAPLDATSKVPVANIPALSYLPTEGGTVSGATSFSSTLSVGGTLSVGTASLAQNANNTTLTADSGDAITFNRSSNYWGFIIGGSSELAIDGLAIYPAVDVGMTCGSSGHRWGSVWSSNGTIQTSDIREKVHICTLNDCGSAIDALEPVRYSWKSTGKVDIGFYAQEVAEVVPEACIKPETEDDLWGFKPDRLIPILVAEIKSLRSRLFALEALIA